jgi:hypothetical protein
MSINAKDLLGSDFDAIGFYSTIMETFNLYGTHIAILVSISCVVIGVWEYLRMIGRD